MKYVVYFAIGWCVMLAGAGEAMAYDGNKLLDYCHDYTEVSDFGAGLCIGYVSGIADSLNNKVNSLPTPFCAPSGVIYKQLVLIIIKYLNDNPAELHKTASILVQRAFMEAFPCTEGN